MGCKQSKALAATAPHGSVVKSSTKDETPASREPLETKKASNKNNNNNNNNNKSSRRLLKNNNNETRSKESSTSTTATANSTNINNINNNNINNTTCKQSEKLWSLLTKKYDNNIIDDESLKVILNAINTTSTSYIHPDTNDTALHVAIKYILKNTKILENNCNDIENNAIVTIIKALIQENPDAVVAQDKNGNIPLHYAIAPTTFNTDLPTANTWKIRGLVIRAIISSCTKNSNNNENDNNNNNNNESIIADYLLRHNNIYYDHEMTGCSPLYRILQTMPDDTAIHNPPTLEYLHLIIRAIFMLNKNNSNNNNNNAAAITSIGNECDGDKPLSLLYRRFTRQFDIAEKFFDGDNSRTEVVEHRKKYKTAAGNTWKMIEYLLKDHTHNHNNHNTHHHRTVHRAVQCETPPDLLRYIVETNAQDLTVPDENTGNLPLHYAALNKPIQIHKTSFPAFYSKYVMDELLYKYPEAASKQDKNGKYPLSLAISSGKQWIGGGIKSLYDAYPEALEQVDIKAHPILQRALSMMSDNNNNIIITDDNIIDNADNSKEGKDGSDDVIQDEQYDAIMLVQQHNVDIAEVVTSMWAHEEDAGVQMLGCVAISRLLQTKPVINIALSAVPAVVNAMKAHPNEVIVQEKACNALKNMASADGKREVSFVASGAVAATVGAMQAHVSDPNVQEEACAALAEILKYGGSDRATIIASVSGLTAIVNAIAAHPDNCGVQHMGCLALKELTEYTSNANLPDLPRSQTENLLLNAKDNFPNECTSNVNIILSRLT